MREPGDVLSYLYDYGDNWELRLRLEDVSPADSDPPAATLLDGRRAAPPEDCGGLTEGAEPARVIGDPERFDAAAVRGGPAGHLLPACGLLEERDDPGVALPQAAAVARPPSPVQGHAAPNAGRHRSRARERGALGPRFEAEATLLVLLFAASSPPAELPVATIARALTNLWWRTAEREELEGHDLLWLDTVEAPRNVGDLSGSGLRWRISPAAALLARAALHRPRTP